MRAACPLCSESDGFVQLRGYSITSAARATRPSALERCGFLVGPAAVVGTQKLSANERVGIAADDTVARNHIVRMHANARTKPIIRVRLAIISCLTGLMPLARVRRLGRYQGCGCGEHADESNRAISLGCRFHLSHRSNLQPVADAIDGENLVTRLRERCDAGHGSDVMRVTRSAFSRAAGSAAMSAVRPCAP